MKRPRKDGEDVKTPRLLPCRLLWLPHGTRKQTLEWLSLFPDSSQRLSPTLADLPYLWSLQLHLEGLEVFTRLFSQSSACVWYVPDTVDVLDGVADLPPQLLLIKLHLHQDTIPSETFWHWFAQQQTLKRRGPMPALPCDTRDISPSVGYRV